MKYSVNSLCPCGSGLKYKKCCKFYHDGKVAKTALELMKSRYSAYAIANIFYIIKTTHNENQDFTTDISNWKKDILEFCKNTDFCKLEILEFIDGTSEAFVTFKATLFSQEDDMSFVEKSKFFKVDGMWLYHSGEFFY
ncbi:MAG: SEC-C domain-containing protein [Epsilonproteobacteria bacterium]|nr:SEC-C domain-containing protein [Campylobacterota bacterium]